jgi:anaerobic ribonucleoside-triphosphate reductase activating protein
MYSGFTLEQLEMMGKRDAALAELLEQIDYLIDGRYEEAQRDLTLAFRGSKNQRIIDMKETRKAGKIITLENL